MKPASIIAIDGPAAAGKSTLAKALAERLGFLYFDTGVMYRAVTLAALQRGIPIDDEAGCTALAEQIEIDVRSPSKQDGRLYDVLVDGEDQTWTIRRPEVDANVSVVSAYPGVRKALTAQQRRVGRRGRVVLVGRDIGTVVFPEADLKIYLDASVEERARRRQKESQSRGEEHEYEQVLESMRTRDRIDASRAVAPLRPAEDAVIVSSDDKDAEQLLETVMRLLADSRLTPGPDRLIPSPSPSKMERGVNLQPKQESSMDEAEQGEKIYHVALAVRFRRWLLRAVFTRIFHLLYRVKIVGRENIPTRGGYIIAHNHISLFEPPFILAFWPIPPEAVAGADVFERPGQGIMVRAYGGIPLHRGDYDREVVETMLRLLRAGLPLMIAPEGGRSHNLGMRRAQPGVAYLMDRARVPVLPVAILGTSDDTLGRGLRGQRPPLEMRIGEAFVLPPIEGKGEARRAARQENADMVMRKIAALLPAKYHGAYTGQVEPGTDIV